MQGDEDDDANGNGPRQEQQQPTQEALLPATTLRQAFAPAQIRLRDRLLLHGRLAWPATATFALLAALRNVTQRLELLEYSVCLEFEVTRIVAKKAAQLNRRGFRLVKDAVFKRDQHTLPNTQRLLRLGQRDFPGLTGFT